MSRRTSNADGTINIQSMSYWGGGDADEALMKELEAVEQHNHEALLIWNALTDEERAERTKKFEEEGAGDIPAFL